MSHDVFISYASADKPVAVSVCEALEKSSIRCWIAPRDVQAGVPYGEAIIDAIHGARVMVLVFSSNANTSGHIPKEVERAVSRGVALVPFRIENVTPAKSLDYFIGSVHWLDAMTEPLDEHLETLANSVQRLLPERSAEEDGVMASTLPLGRQAQPGQFGRGAHGKPTRGPAYGGAPAKKSHTVLWIFVVLLLLAGVGAVLYLQGDLPWLNRDEPSVGITGGAAPRGNEPVIGCWHWINNVEVDIRRDGSLSVGRFSASWRVSDPQRNVYTFIWPQPVDTVTLSPDSRTLSGVNQYGTAISGTRISNGRGITGTWRWFSGVAVNIEANGTFSAGAVNGSWRETDSTRGVYSMAWPTPVDVVTISGNRNQILATTVGSRVLGNRTACSGM
jgi:hypothetical protein